MRAIILISSFLIYDALNRQSGVSKNSQSTERFVAKFFFVALIYAVILDLTE